MSYTNEEVKTLKECLNEIVNENCFSDLHEMKKKLMVSEAKLNQQQEKIDELMKTIETLNKCHECHKIIIEHRHASSQTSQPTRDE